MGYCQRAEHRWDIGPFFSFLFNATMPRNRYKPEGEAWGAYTVDEFQMSYQTSFLQIKKIRSIYVLYKNIT